VRITIRADATPHLGTGHVMRCLALAEELRAAGAVITWRGQIYVPWIVTKLRTSNWAIEEAHPDAMVDADDTVADVVVVDSYAMDWEYRERLQARGIGVVVIADDFHTSLGPGDLWVNPGNEVDRDGTSATTYLNGPAYILLRSEIRGLRTLRESVFTRANTKPKLTVLLGGTDAAGLGSLIDPIFRRFGQEFHIIAGPKLSSINSVATWLPAGPELLREAALSDLVVSPAGVSSWELVHIGVPVALVLGTENQRGNYNWLTRNGLAFGMGSAEELQDDGVLAERLELAFAKAEKPPHTTALTVDGQGTRRVSDAILQMFG